MDVGILKLLDCLCDIQQSCIGEIAMNYKLDAESIGRQITEATGMTAPELVDFLKDNKQGGFYE